MRDAVYVGISVLLCFVASAYFIYSQASAKNNVHNRQRLEAVAWRTANSLNAEAHQALSYSPPHRIDAALYEGVQAPLSEVKVSEAIISRIFTVGFDGEEPRMIVDTEGFPARSWERLPAIPGRSGDFSKETMYFCALSVSRTGKGWVGEIAYPGSTESLVLAMVPIPRSNGGKDVLVVESTSDKLQPTLASLRSAALSSVLMGALVSVTVALAVYSYRRRNIVDEHRLCLVEDAERALVQAVGEAIYQVDKQTNRIKWQGNLTGFGWESGRDLPSTRSEWLAHIVPEDATRCKDAWSGNQPGERWSLEYRIVGKDSRVYWLLDRGQHVAAGSGESLEIGTILNLTPLREAERRLRDVADAAGEYIWEVDASGHYTYVSDRVRDVLGYDSEALIGRHPFAWVPPEDVDQVRKQSEELVSRNAVFRDFEHRMIRKDGEIIWLSTNGVPVLDTAGRLIGYRGAGLDITARKRAEQELIREKEAALAADRAKSEFLAVMSHEIRTPLNSVLGFADLLTESELNESQREQIEMIRRSGDALLVLLNDILDFSRIESGKMPIQPTAVEIRSCLRDVVDLYRATAQAKGVGIEVRIEEEVPSTVCTDPGRLRQILLNLVGNAVKFTPSGSVTVSAKRGSSQNEDGRFPLRIEVSDTGIGIPPDKIARLFKPFSQADSSTTRRFGGTGLGLAICKRLAELLGGDVSLLSSSPRGSTFALEIPLVTIPSLPENARQSSTGLPASGTMDDPSTCRVLVVEDNPVNRMLAQRMLLSLGFSSDAAEDGLRGVEAHTRSPYDIIFMDLQMPEMDGVSAARRIRQLESEASGPRRRVYIIALTADAMSGDRDRCLEAGMDDYLSKPIRRADLSSALDRAVATISLLERPGTASS